MSNYQVFEKEDPSIYSNSSTTSNTSIKNTIDPTASASSSSTAKTPFGEEFEKIIAGFIKKYNPKLYILTPVYGSMVYVDYMTSLIQTIHLFKELGLNIQVEFVKNDSLVTRARNNAVARAMNDPECTHIMFIDADILWTPESVIKLLLADKEVVCGIYPLKHYNFNRLLTDPLNPANSNIIQTWIDKKNASQLKDFITDEQCINYNLLRYNVNFMSTELTIENNIAEIRHAPTGFMMIKRVVFEKLFKSYPSLNYTDDVGFARPGEEKFSFNIFDTSVEKMPDGKNHLLSEDFLFCERYRKINPENHKIYCDVSINLGHAGTLTYQGSFISSLL